MNMLQETLLVRASVVLLSPVSFGTVGTMSYFTELEGVVLGQKFMSQFKHKQSIEEGTFRENL